MDIFIIIGTLIILGVLITFAFIYLKKKLSISNGFNKTLPFKLKEFFFTRSEQEFFNILKSQIDHSKYSIFPKVRLGDFIETTAKGGDWIENWNRIKSKHIDFLIWNIQKKVVVFAIEIDGNSHNNTKMQKSDKFKNKLYSTIGLRFKRIKIGQNFISEVSKILSELESIF